LKLKTLRSNKTAIDKSPAALGYRMPAEWEPHEATWIAWPHNPSDWPGRFQPIAWVYADIVRHLSRVERVHIIVNDAAARAKAQKLLGQANIPAENVEFHLWPTNRVWTRDSGAIFVRNNQGEIAATDWRFNAWAKYPDWKLDDQVAGKMARAAGVPSWQPSTEVGGKQIRVVLEGGSIDVNGRGTMLTTEECLLSEVQQRNPGLSRTDVESVFAKYLGVSKVIWLNKGIAGDDTHGHVDDLARFVAADTVVTVIESNRADENYELLQENLELLRNASDQDGNRLKVVTLQMPAPVTIKGQRVPASYANFYIANGLVLVPTFNDPNDRAALNALAELFPGHKIVGIHCGDFIWGLGAIHCMTQQQPRNSF
jgi:agmatine deiminase